MQFKDTAQIAAKTRPERFRDILINIIKLKLFTEILLPERASHSEAVTHLKMFRRSPLSPFFPHYETEKKNTCTSSASR